MTEPQQPPIPEGMTFTLHGVLVATLKPDGEFVRGPTMPTDEQALATLYAVMKDIQVRAEQTQGYISAWMQRALEAEAELVKLKGKLN